MYLQPAGICHIFELIAVIDWSAAAKPGPSKPSSDRCWVAWQVGSNKPHTEYFRTRHSCMKRLVELTQKATGDVLLAFDFPFGYPFKSGLGGGRQAGRTLSNLLEDNDNDSNNRFQAANELNAVLSELPGPFWGHPKSQDHEHLSWNKPSFLHPGFDEWRIVEKLLKSRSYKIMNVWQLLGQGSVGSQTMTGLARLFDFGQDQEISRPVRFWPFETRWERDLDGIVLAEIWPSLNDHSAIDHSIKDARQVLACLNWLVALNGGENLPDIFKPPSALSLLDQEKCRTEEGWILGVC